MSVEENAREGSYPLNPAAGAMAGTSDPGLHGVPPVGIISRDHGQTEDTPKRYSEVSCW